MSSVASLSSRRVWWTAAGLALTSMLIVLATAFEATRRGQGVPTSFVIWALTPTLTSLFFLLLGRKLQPNRRGTAIAMGVITALTGLLYLFAFWVAGETDTGFLFTFVPLYENGVLIVAGAFTLVVAALPGLDR